MFAFNCGNKVSIPVNIADVPFCAMEMPWKWRFICCLLYEKRDLAWNDRERNRVAPVIKAASQESITDVIGLLANARLFGHDYVHTCELL